VFVTEAELENHLDAAEKSPKQIAAAVLGLPEKTLHYKPSPDKWCILEILGHLADMEILYSYRIRQMLADKDPVIAPIDQDDWALGFPDSMNLQHWIEKHSAVFSGAIIPIYLLSCGFWLAQSSASSVAGSRCRRSIAHEFRSTARNGEGRADGCGGWQTTTTCYRLEPVSGVCIWPACFCFASSTLHS
jgi:hypothetical protein